MKNTDYIVIQAPMVTDLKLSGSRLIIYALIHGFCKDDEQEFTGSIKYICDWTNLTRNTVISTLKSLVDDGLIIKREYTTNNVKFCAYSTGSAKIAPVVQKYKEGSTKNELGGSAKIAPNNVLDNISNTNNKYKIIEKNNISIVDESDFVDRIYNMYPSICPIRQARLGKSYTDKTKIKALLKRYTREDIEKVVQTEVNDKLGKHPLKNFSTFLNNFPDPQSMFPINTNIYPKNLDDVTADDIMPTLDFFLPWINKKCNNVWENLLGTDYNNGWPSDEETFQKIVKHTIGGAKGLCYVILVFNRDGWDKYYDKRGFIWTYSNYIRANGLYKE